MIDNVHKQCFIFPDFKESLRILFVRSTRSGHLWEICSVIKESMTETSFILSHLCVSAINANGGFFALYILIMRKSFRKGDISEYNIRKHNDRKLQGRT